MIAFAKPALKKLMPLGLCGLIVLSFGQRLSLVVASPLDRAEHVGPGILRQAEIIELVAWQPNGSIIAFGSYRNLWLYSDELIEVDHMTVMDGYQLTSIAWSPDGTRLAVLTADFPNRTWKLQIWSLSTWQVELTIVKYDTPLYYPIVLWKPDGTQLAITVNQEVQLRDASTGTLLTTLSGFDLEVTGIDWSHDGSKLATTSLFDLQVWDAVSGSELSAFYTVEGFQYVIWSPDDSLLAITGGERNNIQLWDASALQPLFVLQDHPGAIADLAWSVDRLASVSYKTINIWDVSKRQKIHEIQTDAQVYALAWSPDGTKLAYGGDSGTLEIVNALPL